MRGEGGREERKGEREESLGDREIEGLRRKREGKT